MGGCSNTYDGSRKPITVRRRDPDEAEAKHAMRETFLQPPSYMNSSTYSELTVLALCPQVPVGKENRFYDYRYASTY